MVTFYTNKNDKWAASNGEFLLLGANPDGTDIVVPSECKKGITSQCKVRVCPADGILRILANTEDAWVFTIDGVSERIKRGTSPKSCTGYASNPQPGIFPYYTKMDTDQHDYYQEYLLRPETNCHAITFFTDTTDPNGKSEGEFYIMDYGEIPRQCTTGSCDLIVCPRDGTLRIWSNSNDGWRFTIDGVKELLNYSTSPKKCSSYPNNGHQGSGVAPSRTWMDSDQFDHYQQYSFA